MFDLGLDLIELQPKDRVGRFLLQERLFRFVVAYSVAVVVVEMIVVELPIQQVLCSLHPSTVE